MPITGKENMLSMADVNIPNPLKYPGKLGRNNKSGTLLTKPEWIRQEVKRWIDEMKTNDKYDNSFHSVKSHVLLMWLRKTFNKVTMEESKKMLYDGEAITDDLKTNNENVTPKVVESDVNTDTEDNECHEQDMGNPSSPDMFLDNSDSDMDTDKELSRSEKETIVQKYIQNMDKNMLSNEKDLPDFVRNSRFFKK